MSSRKEEDISSRKDEQIKICLENDVVYENVSNGYKKIRFEPTLLSELSIDDIDLSTSLLGKKIDYPLIVSGMTGGSTKGQKYNEIIAEVCSEFNIAMGVGSQRAAIENPALSETYRVRSLAPTIPLFANLGIAQFIEGYGVKEAQQAIDMIEGDALAIHINPMQELIQKEENEKLTSSKVQLFNLIEDFDKPVIIKGVGRGISKNDASFFTELNPFAIDVAGAGGTNWAKIESYRNSELKYLSSEFLNWGINTARSVNNVRSYTRKTNVKIIASGGMWSGIDAVKALILSADYVAFALPVLKAIAKGGKDELRSFLSSYIFEMKATLAFIGRKNLKNLREKGHLLIGRYFKFSD
ncbi:MAG: type 2 isopentenyl-diphosphate Delta-isomerase [Candidatus Heimdallarchaeota archaeon]|nr:type 2 isopentenyl-diphosphate Delta-isomerase [Candidatus Heimdallarchaeota archaeon]MCK4768771.1 type 2 isopentenyl-diphosphate Delta-isomerase [Candidatus Heimdallarchaeota archaeon]